MTFDAVHLLKRLEPAVRPVAKRTEDSARPIEGQSFDELMTLISAGRAGGDNPVSCACELSPALDEEQLSRIAAATDRAMAAGSRKSVMLIDARALIVDVSAREVTAELRGGAVEAIDTTVDTAVYVAGNRETDRLLAPPAPGLLPWNVGEQIELAQRNRQQ